MSNYACANLSSVKLALKAVKERGLNLKKLYMAIVRAHGF